MKLFKMRFQNSIILLFILFGLSACGGPAPSTETVSGAPPAREVSQNKSYDDGSHVIYFNAINSDFINAEIAKKNNIIRSKNRALINVSIHKKNSDDSKTSVSAQLNDTVSNLTGQLKSVDWRKISEGDAIYYIGLVGIANGETLIFDMKIIPDGQDEVIPVKFQQRFFTD
jgi:hypothetical protein